MTLASGWSTVDSRARVKGRRNSAHMRSFCKRYCDRKQASQLIFNCCSALYSLQIIDFQINNYNIFPLPAVAGYSRRDRAIAVQSYEALSQVADLVPRKMTKAVGFKPVR